MTHGSEAHRMRLKRKADNRKRIESDQRMVDVIRGVFKMEPLYGPVREKPIPVYIESFTYSLANGNRTSYEVFK